MTKKLLAALLAFVMMISALPAQGLVTAAASDAAAGTPALSDAAIVSGSSISNPPFQKIPYLQHIKIQRFISWYMR